MDRFKARFPKFGRRRSSAVQTSDTSRTETPSGGLGSLSQPPAGTGSAQSKCPAGSIEVINASTATFAYATLTRSTIPAGETIYLSLPGGKQCRILWCSVSQPFEPEDLPIGPDFDRNCVTENVVESHGYEIVESAGPKARYRFKERAQTDGGLTHRSLLCVRLWSQTSTTAGKSSSTMNDDVLSAPCLWDACVPSKQHVNDKILGGMISNIPSTRGPVA